MYLFICIYVDVCGSPGPPPPLRAAAWHRLRPAAERLENVKQLNKYHDISLA